MLHEHQGCMNVKQFLHKIFLQLYASIVLVHRPGTELICNICTDIG